MKCSFFLWENSILCQHLLQILEPHSASERFWSVWEHFLSRVHTCQPWKNHEGIIFSEISKFWLLEFISIVYLRNSNSELPRETHEKKSQSFFHFRFGSPSVSIGLVTFLIRSMGSWENFWAKSGIFRNPSNFGELYLRAQSIFFQNFKRSWKVYV